MCIRDRPAIVINQALAERVAIIEDEQRRPVRRREKQELREQLVHEPVSYTHLDVYKRQE